MLQYHLQQAWYKASEQDLSIYKDRLDELLTDITVDDSLLHCRDMFCLKHKEKISKLYSTVITSCINASDHIPTTSKRSGKVKPGWNDNVQLLKSEALSWHKLWKCNGCPRDGYFAEMRRVTRARYHRAIRHIDKHAKTIRMNKMADAIVSNRSRDLWCDSNNFGVVVI